MILRAESNRHAIGAVLTAVGLMFLLMGSVFHVRSTTPGMNSETVLGHDRHLSRRSSPLDSGRSQAGLGLVLLVIGGVVAGQATPNAVEESRRRRRS